MVLFKTFHLLTCLHSQGMFHHKFFFFIFTCCTRAGIIPGIWIHWMWYTILWKWELSIQIIEWTLYSSSTVGSGGAVHFMECGYFTFWLYTNICKCIWDQTKCLQHHIEGHFLGLSIRQGSTVVAWCTGIDMWMLLVVLSAVAELPKIMSHLGVFPC